MSRTTTELATEVMRLPNWISQDETPDSADDAHIKRIYSDWFAYAQMQEREIVYWSEDTIPNEAFLAIVRIIADMVGPSFGDPAPVEIDVETGMQVSMGKKGWNMLRRLTARESSGLSAPGTYF
jgi:hypothetical protein